MTPVKCNALLLSSFLECFTLGLLNLFLNILINQNQETNNNTNNLIKDPKYKWKFHPEI